MLKHFCEFCLGAIYFLGVMFYAWLCLTIPTFALILIFDFVDHL